MSNKVMVLWAMLIVIIVCSLFIIGKNEEKARRIKSQEENYDNIIISYIENNDIELVEGSEIIVNSNDLIRNGYIKEIIKDDSICIFEATVTKNKKYDIKYRYECKVF